MGDVLRHDPLVERASMFTEAAARLRLALNHPDLRAPARLSMAAHILDELVPPPDPDDILRPLGALPRDPAEAAAHIASRLRFHPAPATLLLEQFAGEPLRIKNRRETDRPPCDADRLRLPVRPGDVIYDRTGDLITLSGVPCAHVRLTVIRQLLPPDVAEGLDGDLPFGTLCAGRLARRARAAYPARGGGVDSTALLAVDGQLAGLSWEEVTDGFCRYVSR